MTAYTSKIRTASTCAPDVEYLERGESGVRIGDPYEGYGGRQPYPDETFHITVRNVYSRAKAAVRIAGNAKKLTLDNIAAFDGGEKIVFDKTATISD